MNTDRIENTLRGRSSVTARPPRRAKATSLAEAAPLFAALGDETRLALVVRLGSSGPHSISQLASESPYTRQAITKHLEVLSAAGLVRSDRRGRERIWNVEAGRLDAARHWQMGVEGSGGTPIHVPFAGLVPWLACAVILWLLTGLTGDEWLGFGVCVAAASMVYAVARRRRRI